MPYFVFQACFLLFQAQVLFNPFLPTTFPCVSLSIFNIFTVYYYQILLTLQKHKLKIKSHTSGIPSNLVSKVIMISLSPGLNSNTPVFPQNSLLSLGSTQQCRNCLTRAPLDRMMWSSTESPSLKKVKERKKSTHTHTQVQIL